MKSLIKKILKEETHNRLKQVCFKQLDKFLLDRSEQITHPDYPHSIFFKRKSDGKIIAEIDKKNELFWLDYYSIWSFFINHFVMEYKEIQEIVHDWLEETFKLRGYRPKPHSFTISVTAGGDFQTEGVTLHTFKI